VSLQCRTVPSRTMSGPKEKVPHIAVLLDVLTVDGPSLCRPTT
jgi:hypothetical protein